MSITQAPPVSLRDVAVQAWARHQAEVAEQRRQEIEQAHDRFISEIRAAMQRAFSNSIGDAFSPFDWRVFDDLDITVQTTADDFPYEAVVVFADERFRYIGRGRGLVHVWFCPICGDPQESTTTITSLADLGYWLSEAPVRCPHASRVPGASRQCRRTPRCRPRARSRSHRAPLSRT